MTALPFTIEEAGGWLRRGQMSAVELTRATLARCHATQEVAAPFLAFCDEAALQAARRADEELARGLDRGPLHGIPVAVKDNIATADAPTTANSRVLEPAWGAGRDAAVVERLRAAGAILVGKLALYEFAMGTPDPTKGFPIARNPWNLAHVPGGSSSGSGAAVASGCVLAALGTDTGGSISAPASYCGVSGLRPTLGRVSNYGCVPVAASFDTIGPLARTARDCALVLDAIAGHDARDLASTTRPHAPVASAPALDLAGLRIGVARDFFFNISWLDAHVKQAVEAAIAQLAQAGAQLVEIDIPYIYEGHAAWCAMTFAEAFALHEQDMRTRPELYGKTVRQRIIAGIPVTATDYLRAQAARAHIARACAAALAGVDVVIVPSTGATAPTSEDWDHFGSPSFLSLWCLLGYPVLTLGCGFSPAGMPIGMQIVGKGFADGLVLKVGEAYQQLSDWHTRVAPGFPVDAQSRENAR